MSLARRTERAALAFVVLGALGAGGCDGQTERTTAEGAAGAALPAGIIRHDGPMPSPVAGGASVKSARAQAAGQWDGPEQMYRATCAGCHDPAIKVGPPITGRKLGAPYITYVARHGRNGMPGFFPSEFTDAELGALAAWLDAQPAAPAIPPPGGAP